jgi:sugar porter (SP) family MFS transporter
MTLSSSKGKNFGQLENNLGTDFDQIDGLSVAGHTVIRRHNFYVYRIAIAAALSGFLFGFDTAIINGALIFLRQDFHLTELETELAAGSLLIGCLIGAAGVGMLSDRFGRKRILLVAATMFALSSIAAALPHNLHEFAIARLVAGMAIGAASVVAPMYIAEISPSRIRGGLVSLNQMAIVTGMLSAFCMSWMVSGMGDSSWRFMFAAAALPSLAFLGALFFVPESPRWLLRVGDANRAMDVLRKISTTQAESEAMEIQRSLAEESGTLCELLAPRMRPPLFIAITLAVLSQLTGINTVNYYGAILFRDHAGHSSTSSALGANVMIGLVAFVCTIVAIMVIDRIGRKILLLIGSAGMALSLCLLGIALRVSPPPTTLILIAVLFYIGCFDLSLGPVTWVCLAELFPTAVRGQAMSVATLSLWSACLVVSLSFLSLMRLLSPGGTFWIYAALCVVTFIFVWKWVPETKCRSLEEIQRMWKPH